MEFLTEYGLFLAKIVTFVVAALVVISVIMSAAQKDRGDHEGEGELKIRKLNEKYEKLRESIQSRLMSDHQRKVFQKARKKAQKAEKKAAKAAKNTDEQDDSRGRVYVLDFDGDIKASDTDPLRRAITAVLSIADPEKDEVVIRLESGGGLVHSYGLAAAQLDRIRSKGLRLTACVDKVAASGGYMMACVADRIVASPFAILGSIGVVAQLPNFHRFLKKNDVDFEVLTAGEHKRTMTIFGENTDKGRQKFLEDLEDTHGLFKEYVSERRPDLDIAAVANGDIWFGKRALEVKLIDEIKTSDEYLIEACDRADVVSVAYQRKRTLPEKLGLATSSALEHTVWKVLGAFRNQKFQ
ncbi:serine protease SohB [Marinobacter sp. DSM 26671]|uniref:Putative inner membrane peptidase n=1 Tax=Marinobacter manganoxydans MnI7-9 TaxID=1094979 RepID=G6YR89_9GAMM|nr:MULTISPECIES: protease SohB [Marinobacter]MCP4063014.1 protease SohB [Gammaproteobacteria bacterium]HAS77013.1 protease SohB [Marinobacter adhaerens]EHJ05260.1 putative inner membrane peptidase [Marinobacter manganoxydans MnI7-9]MAK48976.1 protease SohB [Marinobacter sp.]MBI46811.1 protease SohB [Marinobacter sp.]